MLRRDITGKYYPTSCQNMNVSDINEDWSVNLLLYLEEVLQDAV